MISERASRASRRNAQASTGPRTPAGKARSGQNARKHGLSAIGQHPEEEIDRLAKLIAGEHGPDATVLESAWAVADTQLQLEQVRAYKTALLRKSARVLAQEIKGDDHPPAEMTAALFVQLEALDRYERRALSRRKFAARGFHELVMRLHGKFIKAN